MLGSQKNRERAAVFCIGAVGYPLLELLWRRRTHISMSIAGGVCFSILYRIHKKKQPLLLRCAQGAAAVTLVELATGLLVNRALCLQVWDYSHKRFNLWGQICAHYSILWLGLAALVSPLCGRLRRIFARYA